MQKRKIGNSNLEVSIITPFRGQVVIATKFGIKIDSGGQQAMDSRPENIKRSAEGSLKRLRVEAINRYYQHRVDPEVPIQGARYPEALEKKTGL
jgi:aryl-alcohol dehydrogenase-like predicted oxidoreductase